MLKDLRIWKTILQNHFLSGFNQFTNVFLQVVRGSTNIDLSRDDDGATADRSNAPIALGNADVEVVDETKCCCFFKRKIKKSSRNKWLAVLQAIRRLGGASAEQGDVSGNGDEWARSRLASQPQPYQLIGAGQARGTTADTTLDEVATTSHNF